jgi:hypothetical protein
VRTVAVIPTRYEPARLHRLLRVVVPDVDLVIVLDNGHAPRLTYQDPKVRVVDARGWGIYRMWNEGWRMARAWSPGPVNVAVLNDDVRILPGTLPILATALRSEAQIGAVYPDSAVHLSRGLPETWTLETDWDPVGSRKLTGYCFMFRGELPLPPFDEGYGWWYGDSQFDECIRLLGYGPSRVVGLPVEHKSDAETDDWARRPELKAIVEEDGKRWAELHAEIRHGKWWPMSERISASTVLLVPRRDDGGHRDALWKWARARWERYFPDVPIFEGHHVEGPFNRSAAVNTAARLAGSWDLGIVIDSDILVRVTQLRAAIERARETGRVTWAHRRWRGISEEWTDSLIRHETDLGAEIDELDIDVLVERTNPISWSCCVVIPRRVWDDMGGFDERFIGWGFEDMAFKSLVQGLYGWERIEGDVIHLWHPRSEERIVKGYPAATASPDYIANARLGRRYMVAQYRDVGLGDEPGVLLPDELRARHVSNLQKDDSRLTPFARTHGLPDWTDWWPTLEELREGAQAALRGPDAMVTLVVHTGGPVENWPVRRGYLERAMASLIENVSGPIVKRVIYDCWGDPDIREWLQETYGRHGFFVVGPREQVDYTGSMQSMWAYLARHARGEYIFQAEDDFVYERPVDLGPMIEALIENPYLVQVALLRDACYADERETGGILGWPEPAFTRAGTNGTSRLEHRLFFTANPCLFRKSLTATPWPGADESRRILGRPADKQPSSETAFGKVILRDSRVRFAFWGTGENWIRHIGEVRAGAGY